MAMGVWRGSLAGRTKGELRHVSPSPMKDILIATGFYMLVAVFVIGVVPLMFNLPHSGNMLQSMIFMAIFLLATAAGAYLLSMLFTDSESVNLVVPFFSIGLIFLSGISFPRDCMPWFWQICYYIFPCSPGITGYIKLNSLGAPFESAEGEIILLGIQAAVYIALIICITNRKRESYKRVLIK